MLGGGGCAEPGPLQIFLTGKSPAIPPRKPPTPFPGFRRPRRVAQPAGREVSLPLCPLCLAITFSRLDSNTGLAANPLPETGCDRDKGERTRGDLRAIRRVESCDFSLAKQGKVTCRGSATLQKMVKRRRGDTKIYFFAEICIAPNACPEQRSKPRVRDQPVPTENRRPR